MKLKGRNITISHLVAAAENNVIGKDGGMPWHLPDDFRYFKNTTWAMPVIMGRKTFETMGKALPGRINIVVTANPKWQAEDTFVAHSIDKALEMAWDADTKEIFIIGGGSIFEETMKLADRIYMTRIHTKLDGETKYQPIDKDVWKQISERKHPEDKKHAYAFSFEVWERK